MSVPTAPRLGVESFQVAEAVATPWAGEESTPTSVTESPSGSMPLSVTGIVTA